MRALDRRVRNRLSLSQNLFEFRSGTCERARMGGGRGGEGGRDLYFCARKWYRCWFRSHDSCSSTHARTHARARARTHTHKQTNTHTHEHTLSLYVSIALQKRNGRHSSELFVRKLKIARLFLSVLSVSTAVILFSLAVRRIRTKVVKYVATTVVGYVVVCVHFTLMSSDRHESRTYNFHSCVSSAALRGS